MRLVRYGTCCGLLVSAILAIASARSFGQGNEGHRVVTPTRLQVLFFGLESDWLKAVQQKDGKALDDLLDDEFQVWRAAPPGDPMPREEWQATAFGKKPASFAIRQIAVRSLTPQISVASFVLEEKFDKQQESYFVVDVWNSAGEKWKCSDRYISPVSTSSPAPRR